jgi:hypothetical protein
MSITRSVNSPALNTFHRFSKLPLELQRMIWQECIPERYINLGLLWHWEHLPDAELDNPDDEWEIDIMGRGPPPKHRVPTLLINRESYEETMLYHRLYDTKVFSKDAFSSLELRLMEVLADFNDPRWLAPMLINARKDSFFFQFEQVYKYKTEFIQWIRELGLQLPGRIGSITELEIQDIGRCDGPMLDDELNFLKGLVREFPGIRRLCLTTTDDHIVIPGPLFEQLSAHMAECKEVYQRPGLEITVREYDRRLTYEW